MNINKEFTGINDLITEGKHEEAQNRLISLKKQLRKEDNFAIQFNFSSLEITLGKELHDSQLLTQGIKDAKSLLTKKIATKYFDSIYYNIAAGNDCLNQIERISLQKEYNPFIHNRGLDIARTNLIKIKDINAANTLTNIANNLDELGRPMEALPYYEKAYSLNHEHSLAIGNYAICIRSLAEISGRNKIVANIFAYQLLKKALELKDNAMVEGGLSAIKEFESVKKQIEDELGQKKEMLNYEVKYRLAIKDSMSQFEKFFIRTCQEKSLFLSVHIAGKYSDASSKDNLELNNAYLEGVSNDIINMINEIKQTYVSARFSYIQALYPKGKLNKLSQLTSYNNTEDNLNWELQNSLLKSSFTQLYCVFDKIGEFLVSYLSIPMEKKDYYFPDIWKKDKLFHPQIENTKSYILYGVYSIAKEISTTRFLADIQNDLKHGQIFLCSKETGYKGNLPVFSIEDFSIHIDSLFQYAKSAITSLILFVDYNNSRSFSHKRKA